MPDQMRKRVRELGVVVGELAPGPLNAITDVAGVRVGHASLVEGEGVRTGVTAVLPHPGNLFQEKVPAGVAVANGFGKLMGYTQMRELGEIETPILLTNTLAVPRAADALITWTLAQPGNGAVRSVNPVVGETNDGYLNDIRQRVVTAEHGLAALATAVDGPVPEGNVGAGVGVVCLGWKGGIGTSSRRLPEGQGGYTLGALVQANFGGTLQILGRRILPPAPPAAPDGSIMILIATDAPLSDRNLTRLARRAFAGLARSGAAMANGSGDYAISFSTAEAVRRTLSRRQNVAPIAELPNDLVSPLFLAASEATQEAIYNALCMAETLSGYNGRFVTALPLSQINAHG